MFDRLYGYRLLQRGAQVLSVVEANGIKIDVPYLRGARGDIEKQIAEKTAELESHKVFRVWRERFGDRTKLGSKDQLAKVMFEDLGHKARGWTATGKYKADESTFQDVDEPFVKEYFKLEKLRKLHGTYLKGILAETTSAGYLHPSFNLNTVQTFRGSCSNPNFQNVPVRNPLIGNVVRRCVVPRGPKRSIVEIDYSGIEVRVAACYHKDPVMLTYIRDPSKDMHRDMAAQLFKMSPKEVSKQCRYVAKNMYVFPQFYGSYYVDCASHMWAAIRRMDLKGPDDVPLYEHLKANGITRPGKFDPREREPQPRSFEAHVRDVERDFWGNRFKVYADWKRRWYDAYCESRSFELLTGFRITGHYRRNEVINYPVQGAAFHCLLWSLIEIQRQITKRKMKTRLIGQIHDSLLADVPDSETQDYLDLAEDVMTRRLLKAWDWIVVPLDIEVEASPESWAAKAPWVRGDDGTWGAKG